MLQNIIETHFQAHCQRLEFYSDLEILNVEFCMVEASLAALKKEMPNFLHPKELEYWHALKFERRQQSYLLGRYCAKKAITNYNKNLNFSDIYIKPGIFEQPIVYHPGLQKIQVSLSHCGSLGAAMAFPESHPMGVDIEETHKDKEVVIASQLTPSEKLLIENKTHDNSKRIEFYTLFWTLKEALSKTLRTGLTTPFEIYAIEAITEHTGYWMAKFKNFTQYQAMAFPVGRNCICALVFPKQLHLKQIPTSFFKYFMLTLT